MLKYLACPLSLNLAGKAWAGGVRPNIVLFLVDGLGWQDSSHPFHTEKTKHTTRSGTKSPRATP